jgi:dihydropyrimidinase
MTVTGWPEIVISAGRVIVENSELHAAPGSGRFIPRGTPLPCATPREPSQKARFFRSLAFGDPCATSEYGTAYGDDA